MDRNRIRRREAGGEDRDAEEDKERRTRVREMENYNTGVELLSSLFSLKAYDSHTRTRKPPVHSLQYQCVLCAAGRHCPNCSRSAVLVYIVTELGAGTIIVVLSLSP